jgi:deoxyribodipyrimidine photolyase
MSDARPMTLFWFRRDLRLSDHPGLSAAAEAGGVR